MALTPDTTIRLIKSPLELDYKNQLTFASKQAQETYFKSLPHIEIDSCSYQRHNNFIRWPGHIDSLLNYNYVMYQNDNYSNKWFYAFIIKMEYHNDGETYIYIQQDVFQTWQFDITWKQSFVEREMIAVNEDVPGANLLVEDLETGEYIENATSSVEGVDFCYVIAYSRNPQTDGYSQDTFSFNGTNINGIFSGLYYYVCSYLGLTSMLGSMSTGATPHDDSIVEIFTVPKLAVEGLTDILDHGVYDPLFIGTWVNQLFTSNGKELSLSSVHSTLDGYSPRNQKLKTYPFTYLGFNPSNGSSKIFRYEDFTNNPEFSIRSEVNPAPSVLFIPKNYKKSTGQNIAETCSLSGYPTIGYHTEYFNSWIARNQNLINLDIQERNYNDTVAAYKKGIDVASDIAKTTFGAMSGEGSSSGLAGVAKDSLDLVSIGVNNEFYIQKQMAQVEAQKLLPNKGVIGSGNGTLLGYGLFDDDIFKSYSIKAQFAERIDKYFDMYGYKTNQVKIPNLNNRPNWNYIKTIGANILGDIPQQDMEIIKNMFNAGITLWHNTSNFLDYSQNNR